MDCSVIESCALGTTSWAAWVQAIGSVGAIIAAIAIAYKQRDNETKDRKYEAALAARSMAAVILKQIKALRERLNECLEDLPAEASPSEGLTVKRAEFPQSLWDVASQLHVLGNASSPILSAMFEIQEGRDLFTTDRSIFGSELNSYRSHMERALANCESAISALRDILSSEPTR